MKGTYRQFDHTGDVGIEAAAPDVESLFACCAEALFDIIAGEAAVRPASPAPISVEAPDLESLMVRWLRELLYLHDTGGWLFSEFEIERIEAGPSACRLAAVARGERPDPEHRPPLTELKAVTYHQIEVRSAPGSGWTARVVFDV